MLERARRGEHRHADDVQHEQGHALQVHDEQFTRQRGDCEEHRADEENLHDDDREKGLQIPCRMIRPDAGMIGPGGEGADEGAGHQPEEHENGRDERAGPAPAQIGELGDRLGEQHLVRVALEIAQYRGAEYRSDDDEAEQAGNHIVQGVAEGPIQQHLAVGAANRPEALRGDAEERESEPEQKVDIGRHALGAEAKLEGKEFPEHCHDGLPQPASAWSVGTGSRNRHLRAPMPRSGSPRPERTARTPGSRAARPPGAY